MLCVGILYTYIMAAMCSYKILTVVCGIVPIIFVLAFLKAPETPLYLLKKDKRQQAEKSLRVLRGAAYNVYRELHSLENDLTNESGPKVNFFKAASTKANKKALVIAIGLMVLQQLSGVNVVIFYAGIIFKDAGSSINPDVGAILMGIAQVIATAFSAMIIDKAGRKILLQISDGVMAICHGILGFYFLLKMQGHDVSSYGWMPVMAVIVYITLFAIGFGPIPWIMTGEVLGADIKGIATGLAVAVNWFLAFVVTKSFQPLVSSIGEAMTYWMFTIICILGVGFCTFIVIETKGKTLTQVQMELSGKRIRTTAGRLGSSFQLLLTVGILYSYALGLAKSWKLLNIMCGVVPIVFVAAFIMAPETPFYLLKKGRKQQAESTLRKLRGSSYDIRYEIQAMESQLMADTGVTVSFKEAISTRASILATIITFGLMIFQQLSGVNVVIFFASTIFQKAGSNLDSLVAAVMMGAAQVIATAVSALIIDKAGRKILLQLSDGIMAICLGILGIYFYLQDAGKNVSSIGWLPLLSVIVYIIVFALGFGPIPWMMASEVLNADIKGPISSIAVALNWSLAFAVTVSFQPLVNAIGNAATFWIYTAICVLGFLFDTFVVIETKGKELSAIQDELAGQR